LTTLGCRLNEAELAQWARAFASDGHQVVPTPAQAQVMVLNTCAVTGEAARKSRQLIKRVHRENPTARLVVTGCYAELERERVAELTGVDLVVGNGDKQRLVEEVSRDIDPHAMPRMASAPTSSALYRAARTRAFVKVQDGCRNRCTFCIVTVARGEERSRAIADVVDEVRALATEGHREVVLTGVHLGGYGSDLGSSLTELTRAVLADTDVPRVRLSSLEPWDLPEDFFDLWSHPRLMPHLHLPLQNGHDEILRRMARRCSTSQFSELVERARDVIEDLTVTTDFIVGFPGETDDHFAASLDYVERIGFGHMHIFSYSRRDGTRAARMPGEPRGDVKRERSRRMHELAARCKREHLRRFVGTVRPVLWESGQRGDHGEVVYTGYTDNYLRVETVVPETVDLDNVITPAALVDAGAGRLVAELSAVELSDHAVAATRPRTRLRVVD